MALIRQNGRLRGSTDVVLNETLPLILFHDSLVMPEKLVFVAEEFVVTAMLKKALRYLDETRVKVQGGKNFIFWVHRCKSKLRYSANLRRDYFDALKGLDPSRIAAFTDASTVEDSLKAFINICQSMHTVLSSCEKGKRAFPACKLNPAGLSCTCKGFRMLSLCSHVIAVTCEYIRDADCVTGYSTYDRSTIEMMLEKLVSTKPAAHRPPKTMRGTQIQKWRRLRLTRAMTKT
jgi:hypothetical protein